MRDLLSKAFRAGAWILWLTVVLPALGCSTPTPTPDPGPGPVDAATPYPFTGLVADCDADSAQSPSVLSPASSCGAGEETQVDGCMVDLLTTWPADAIACGARSVGIRAAISVAGGDAGAADRSAAANLRRWIGKHDIMFQN